MTYTVSPTSAYPPGRMNAIPPTLKCGVAAVECGNLFPLLDQMWSAGTCSRFWTVEGAVGCGPNCPRGQAARGKKAAMNRRTPNMKSGDESPHSKNYRLRRPIASSASPESARSTKLLGSGTANCRRVNTL